MMKCNRNVLLAAAFFSGVQAEKWSWRRTVKLSGSGPTARLETLDAFSAIEYKSENDDSLERLSAEQYKDKSLIVTTKNVKDDGYCAVRSFFLGDGVDTENWTPEFFQHQLKVNYFPEVRFFLKKYGNEDAKKDILDLLDGLGTFKSFAEGKWHDDDTVATDKLLNIMAIFHNRDVLVYDMFDNTVIRLYAQYPYQVNSLDAPIKIVRTKAGNHFDLAVDVEMKSGDNADKVHGANVFEFTADGNGVARDSPAELEKKAQAAILDMCVVQLGDFSSCQGLRKIGLYSICNEICVVEAGQRKCPDFSNDVINPLCDQQKNAESNFQPSAEPMEVVEMNPSIVQLAKPVPRNRSSDRIHMVGACVFQLQSPSYPSCEKMDDNGRRTICGGICDSDQCYFATADDLCKDKLAQDTDSMVQTCVIALQADSLCKGKNLNAICKDVCTDKECNTENVCQPAVQRNILVPQGQPAVQRKPFVPPRQRSVSFRQTHRQVVHPSRQVLNQPSLQRNLIQARATDTCDGLGWMSWVACKIGLV